MVSDPTEWRTSWLGRVSGLLERDGDEDGEGDLSRLLPIVHEGARLRRRLDELAEDPVRSDYPEVDDLLERLQDEATRRLSDPGRPPGVDPKLAASTARRLRADQSYLGSLLTRPDLDPLRRAGLLDRFRRDLGWLSELVSLVDGAEPPHPAVSARVELDRLEEALRAEAPPESLPKRLELSGRAEHLRRSLLGTRVAQLLRRAIPDGEPAALWGRRFLLSRLQAEVEALPGGAGAPGNDRPEPVDGSPRRHLPALVARRDELADAASDRLAALPPEARSAAWDELLTASRGESNEIVSLLEEASAEQGVLLLARSREDMLRLRDDCAGASRAALEEGIDRPLVGHLRRLARRFNRMARTARDEWQEKDLSARLQARFGPRFPKRLDGLILVLILALTGLIIAETMLANSGRLTHRLEAVFAWADLLICSVFLAELSLKFSLARGKFLYFRRHLLIDLLPSIPFGFIAFALAGPAQAGWTSAIRILRVPRLIRYVRILRPLIRFVRLFIFFFRFSDRLVRRYARIFNRNIILFELKSGSDDESRNRHLLYLLRRHYDRRAPEHYAKLDPGQRIALAGAALEDLARRVGDVPAADWSERSGDETRDVPVEEVVDLLIELTPEDLTERMGPAFVGSVDRYLALFDVPIVRRLPLIRPILEHREKGPAEAAALAANLLGHLMQRALDVIYYFADLQATVSPPLFLDKLGRTIVTATRRPAFRLLSFGIAFATLYALVYLLVPSGDGAVLAADEAGAAPPEVGVLHGFGLRLRGILSWFADKLGLPVVVIGVVCFVLMQVGGWFRRIANQAAEFCDRIVEAQFAAQTKMLKHRRRARDLRFLAERVTAPEVRLRTSDDLEDGAGIGVEADPGAEPAGLGDGVAAVEVDVEDLGIARDARMKSSETDFLHTLRLLYRDYLDGSPFHRNDTKASTQLLGNLALRNLSLSNLPSFLKGRRRLDRLDLNRAAASLFGGPYLWFDYITRMIVQETAKLLIDYNRHAVPLDRLAGSPDRARGRYRAWLASRLRIPEAEVALPDPVGRPPGGDRGSPARDRPEAAEFFETVDFTAVDFLIADPRRDEEIRLRYGDAVASLLRRDRQRNLRAAFRSLPLHRAPIAQRTINPFHLYESYLAKGRLLALPFRLSWWALRGVGTMGVRVVRVIREILHPTISTAAIELEDSYQAAVRKIHRMRKPAFMESLWMRARFDVEYLGLPLPTVPISVGSDSLMEIDLDFIGASRHERVMADRYRQAQRDRLARHARWQAEFGWDFDPLGPVLDRDLPHLSDRRGEVIRALVVAWVADHDDVESLGTAIDALRAVLDHAADPSADPRRLPEGLPEPPDPGAPRWHRVRDRDARRQLANLPDLPCFRRFDDQERTRILRYLRRHRGVLRGWTRIVLGQGGPDPVATLRARFEEVMLRTDLWSDQILTLRTIQTLTMLDVQHYTELVWTLGGFDRLDLAPSPGADLPFADPEEAEEALVG